MFGGFLISKQSDRTNKTWKMAKYFAVRSLLLASGASALTLRTSTPLYEPQPYTIAVNDSLIEETLLKVKAFRNSDGGSTPAWLDGPPTTDIESFAEYWANEYDWSTVEAEINANFSHFYTTVPPPSANYTEPVDLHFIHQKSRRDDAIPILFLHGWPSTSLEWASVIPSLVNPEDASDPAFHVVAPDFPAFGFSPDFTVSRENVSRSTYATIFTDLMSQLGYDRFILYSTDLGFAVANALIVDYTDHVINHITDFYFVFISDEDRARFNANLTTAEESTYIKATDFFLGELSGYSGIHRTLPLAIAYALNDSPVGFLAWYYNLAGVGTDRPFSPRDVVTNTLLLWLPGVYGNIRSYKELFGATTFVPDKNFTVPTSVLQFGGTSHYPELEGFILAVSQTTYV